MKFKLIFDEKEKRLYYNCLNAGTSLSVAFNPKDTAEHVFYPLPNILKHEIKKELSELITPAMNNELNEISENIRNLVRLRQEKVIELRRQLNSKVIEKCEKVRDNNAELFI